MLVVGLTGGIASGKSTVSSLLRQHGIPIVDADILARRVVEPGQPAYNNIVRHFGSGVLQDDKTLDRKKLGEVIFKDPAQRKILNGITHPAVRREMFLAVVRAWWKGNSVCILDVPLLIEAGMWKMTGYVVVVTCSPETQLTRMITRDGLSEDAARDRLGSQMSLKDKVAFADTVIDNSGTLEELEQQVAALVTRLKKDAGWSWRLAWYAPPFAIIFAVWRLLSRTLQRTLQSRRKTFASSRL